MVQRIIVLSGRVSTGKSTLAVALAKQYGCHHVRTRQLIERLLSKTPLERRAMQEAGDRLDRRTDGTWVASAVSKLAQTLPSAAQIVIDSVRIKAQIDALRKAFGG